MLPQILESFAPGSANHPATAGLYLTDTKLLDYCARYTQVDEFPLDAISQQCDDVGETLGPSPEHSAVLCWLGIALQYWEQHYPLESDIANKLRQLRPLLTLCAVTNDTFLIPGAHPLHQLMDALQARAVGWQPQLGRAGQTLERLIDELITQSQSWMNAITASDDSTAALPPIEALQALTEKVLAACEKDRARVQRMVQRVVESNQGRIKASQARRVSAQFINQIATPVALPLTVIEFLHGPWYNSLQLIVLKHGSESDAWQEVCSISQKVVDSVIEETASENNSADSIRQRVFEAATELPQQLKRWLLSLQHDNEATDDAVGLVEMAHLKLMKQQQLERRQPAALPVEAAAINMLAESDIPPHITEMNLGDWFELQTDSGQQRVQLALNLPEEQQLLFVNQAGIKTVTTTYRDFLREYHAGAANKLANLDSLSTSLAWAAGIIDQNSYNKAAQSAKNSLQSEQESGQSNAGNTYTTPDNNEEQQAKEKAKQKALEEQQAKVEAEKKALEEQQAREEAEKKALEEQQAREEAEKKILEQQAREEAERSFVEPPSDSNLDDNLQSGYLSDFNAIDDSFNTPALKLDIHLPMGSWLGFHDSETPMLARLAVHDPVEDHYIFVNREGIKLRELAGTALAALVEEDMVDIIETRSSFRDMLRKRGR